LSRFRPRAIRQDITRDGHRLIVVRANFRAKSISDFSPLAKNLIEKRPDICCTEVWHPFKYAEVNTKSSPWCAWEQVGWRNEISVFYRKGYKLKPRIIFRVS